jgi:hypothetical protein
LLNPYGYRWFRVGGLDYLLERTEVWPAGLTWSMDFCLFAVMTAIEPGDEAHF